MGTVAKVIGGIGVVALWVVFAGGDNSAPSPTSYGRYGIEYEDTSYIDDQEYYEELAYEYWDDVREYMIGTEVVDACSDSGCYSLDADIYDGYIVEVYFPNGGYIQPDAEIGDDGFAEGYDSDGGYWEFYLDLDSDTVQDAISDWAADYASDRAEYREYDYRR